MAGAVMKGRSLPLLWESHPEWRIRKSPNAQEEGRPLLPRDLIPRDVADGDAPPPLHARPRADTLVMRVSGEGGRSMAFGNYKSRLVYGCFSNGLSWEFGKLDGSDLTQEIRQFILSDLPGLFAAWNDVFTQAREQALAPAA